MSGRARKGTKLINKNACVHKGTVFKVADCVLMNPDPPTNPAFVGRILEILGADDEGDTQIKVAWFYRPEEALGGRKDFHGEKELFISNHQDQVSINSIISKCRVHDLKEYERLGTITEVDFFARFTYDPNKKEFTPDRVPVYCKCEMPYNPDKPMLKCDNCDEWFHLACISLNGSKLDDSSPYICDECVKVLSQESKRAKTDPTTATSQATGESHLQQH